jgi:UDP-glucose 4-epimerase
MRVAVTGATGNVGTAVVSDLDRAGYDVLGIARRAPDGSPKRAGVTWAEADVANDDLMGLMDGADVLVHLAWRFQPTRRPEVTWQANAVGTRRVLDAASTAGVPHVICLSSVAAYSPAPDDSPLDETWPTDGTSAAAYCREKAYVERLLDILRLARPETRVAWLRPAFVFQRGAASEQRRIFGGPAARPLLFKARPPVLPVPSGLRFQAVHADDVASAVTSTIRREAEGPFNIAADDLVDRAVLGRLLGARTVEVPPAAVGLGLRAAFRGRVAPVPGELFDALHRIPVMSTRRAEEVLGWRPGRTSASAVQEFLRGAAGAAGAPTPPLHAS